MDNVAHQIIDIFGGLTPLSRALGHRNPSTVQGWKNSGRVPSWRVDEVRRAASTLGKLSEVDAIFRQAPQDAA